MRLKCPNTSKPKIPQGAKCSNTHPRQQRCPNTHNLYTILVILMWKWISLFLRKKHLLRCWGWPLLLNWSGALTLSLLLKMPPWKLEPWFVLWSFFLLKLLCISINLPYAHACNTAVMSKLVFLVSNWKCWISYKNGYAGCSGPSIVTSLKPCLGSLSKCNQFKSFL